MTDASVPSRPSEPRPLRPDRAKRDPLSHEEAWSAFLAAEGPDGALRGRTGHPGAAARDEDEREGRATA